MNGFQLYPGRLKKQVGKFAGSRKHVRIRVLGNYDFIITHAVFHHIIRSFHGGVNVSAFVRIFPYGIPFNDFVFGVGASGGSQ